MNIEIITLKKKICFKDIISVIVPGVEGVFCIYKNHTNIISFLKSGLLRIRFNDGEKIYKILNGIVEVNNNNIKIMIDDNIINI